jgi:hypothetical protein
MQKRVVEETHLLQARSFVVAGTARIADLCLIIGRLRAHGLDTRQAEHCLQTMQETLTVIRGHKELIEEELARSRRVEARSRKVL